MSKKYLLFILALLFLTFAVFSNEAFAQSKDCSHLVVNRSYSQTFEGFNNLGLFFGGSYPLVPGGGVGVETFLPNGEFSARMTIAIGQFGLMQDLPATGHYSLSWDTSKEPVLCTGTLSVSVPGLGDLGFQLVVAPGGQQVESIHTDFGLVVGVTALPVPTKNCSNNSVQGRYRENAKGWALSEAAGLPFPPTQLVGGYAPFAFSGGLQFNPRVSPSLADFPHAPQGAGSVTGWDFVNIGGLPASRTETGWYKLESDCSGIIVLRDNMGHPDFRLELFAGDAGKTVHMMNIDTAPDGVTPMFILALTGERADEGQH